MIAFKNLALFLPYAVHFAKVYNNRIRRWCNITGDRESDDEDDSNNEDEEEDDSKDSDNDCMLSWVSKMRLQEVGH